jgi:hypothetical protein
MNDIVDYEQMLPVVRVTIHNFIVVFGQLVLLITGVRMFVA